MADKAVKKKPNILKRIGNAIVRFFRDTRGEVKKVVWPSRKQVINNTIVVAVFVVICAVLIFGLDLVFNWLFDLVMRFGEWLNAA